MQELQLSKIARDLRKELEMEQLRDSIRKLNEDYKSVQGPGATRELQQYKTAHESGGEELKQLRIILEKLASDHENFEKQFKGLHRAPRILRSRSDHQLSPGLTTTRPKVPGA